VEIIDDFKEKSDTARKVREQVGMVLSGGFKNANKTEGTIIKKEIKQAVLQQPGDFLGDTTDVAISTITYKDNNGIEKTGVDYHVNDGNWNEGDIVDICYLNSGEVLIDDVQFSDKNVPTFLNTKEKKDVFIKNIKKILPPIIIALVLSLVSIFTLNVYVILISVIFTLVLCFLYESLGFTKKNPDEAISGFLVFPFILNLFVVIVYLGRNINDLSMLDYVVCAIQLILILILAIKSRSKNKK